MWDHQRASRLFSRLIDCRQYWVILTSCRSSHYVCLFTKFRCLLQLLYVWFIYIVLWGNVSSLWSARQWRLLASPGDMDARKSLNQRWRKRYYRTWHHVCHHIRLFPSSDPRYAPLPGVLQWWYTLVLIKTQVRKLSNVFTVQALSEYHKVWYEPHDKVMVLIWIQPGSLCTIVKWGQSSVI